MTRYFFAIDSKNGRVFIGSAIHSPEERPEVCSIEGDEQVWLNQGRAFYINGSWYIYPPISVTVPTTNVNVNQVVTATATLPPGSPDTEVQFCVAWQDSNGEWHRTDPITVPVVNDQASKDFQFAEAGVYCIEAMSEHHGGSFVEVTVS